MMRAGMIKRLAPASTTTCRWPARDPQGGEHHPHRDDPRRRGRARDAGGAACRAVAGDGPLRQDGPELLRVKDRHGRDFIIRPHQVPGRAPPALRPDARPRIHHEGRLLLRPRRSRRPAQLRQHVRRLRQDLRSLGLQYRAVAADTGAIGGDRSHEFQVIADTGEDAIIYCPTSDYAANIELAEALSLIATRGAATQALTKTATPGKATCADVAELLKLPLSQTVKSLVWLLLVRGDHDLNEVKVGKLEGLKGGFRFATAAEIDAHFGCKPGYLARSPEAAAQGHRRPHRRPHGRLRLRANEADFHFTGANWGRDLPEPDLVADIRNVVAGDPSPDGKGVLAIQRGIEVGHVFYLGTKYSAAMNATFLDENGKPQLFEMGCYGIGVTRIVGAAIEQNHDARGIIWPRAIAPFTAVICPIGMDRSEEVKAAATKLYDELLALGVDVLLDDRGERPGAMFADWELVGVPHRVVISDRGLKKARSSTRAVVTPKPASWRWPTSSLI
ncbi:tRNA synthetase class II core domain (G, h, p, S and t) domain-containing protein [Ditylenchus destructor]|nr:tRNA synthetase class II core domain (G, h, p, S and t) domain-containing protein [Ditylenchus destructor]